MKLELTTKQFRRLLDMAYIGNWILNSTRGDDRFRDYDEVESLLFAKAREAGMTTLAEDWQGEVVATVPQAITMAFRSKVRRNATSCRAYFTMVSAERLP